MKNKKALALITIAVIFLGNLCHADVIGPQVPFYSTPLTMLVSNLAITLAVEMFFAWIIFFKKDRGSLLSVFIVNIISQPVAQLSLFYLSKNYNVLFLLIPIEVAIIFFEAVAYKFLLDGVSFWRALKISFMLNILSVVVGYIIFLMMLFVGMFLPNFARKSPEYFLK
jgi:hypothetical protein